MAIMLTTFLFLWSSFLHAEYYLVSSPSRKAACLSRHNYHAHKKVRPMHHRMKPVYQAQAYYHKNCDCHWLHRIEKRHADDRQNYYNPDMSTADDTDSLFYPGMNT